MTAPDLPDIPMPFGVVYATLPSTSVLAPAYLSLPAGVSTIQVTWDGPQRLRITTSDLQSDATRETLMEIPAGSGLRTIIIPGVGVRSGQDRYFSLISAGVPSPESEATVQIITMPLQ